MRFNGFYFLVMVVGVGLVFISTRYFNTSVNGVPAVATSRELIVRSEFRAEVKAVGVQPGQQVHKGDTLVVLSSVVLEQDQERLARKLSSLQTEQSARESAFRSSLELARNEINLELTRLDESINQAAQELSLNARLSERAAANTSESPLAVRIRDLKAQADLYRAQLRQKEAELKSAHQADQAILQNQIDLAAMELKAVEQSSTGLVKIAAYDGVMESVAVRPGLVIEAFTALLVIRPDVPTIAVAYVQGDVNPFLVGMKAVVSGFEGIGGGTEGTVIGFGSIAALPEILQKSTAIKAFGKEVFIELPVGNPFTAGQKILVQPTP